MLNNKRKCVIHEISGEKPFVERERTNNKLTQPMHLWRRFRDINPAAFSVPTFIPIPPQAYIYAKTNTL